MQPIRFDPRRRPGFVDRIARTGSTSAWKARCFGVCAVTIGCGGSSQVAPSSASTSSTTADVPETRAALVADAGAPSRESGHTVTVLVSDSTKTYCDGAIMDSEGYRKTITKPKTVTLADRPANEARRLQSIVVAATNGMCREIMKATPLKLESGVVHVPPVSGWAGMSITMCTCRPEVEVNLLRVPGVAKVVWEE